MALNLLANDGFVKTNLPSLFLLLSLGSTKSQPELVKIGEITKNNPKLTLKQRLDNFDNKVANALYNFFHHKEI